jgi:hypothetical protein
MRKKQRICGGETQQRAHGCGSLIDSLPFANKFEPIAFRDIFDCLGSNHGIKSARNGATLQIFCHFSSRVSKASAASTKKKIYHQSTLPKI